MNAVHPTFAPLLAAISPPQSSSLLDVIAAKDAIIRSYQPPPCPIGWLEYIHKTKQLEIVCHLEYEPAEDRGTCAGPAQGAIFRLVHAYVNSVDVVQLIAPALVEEIEEKAAQAEDHYAY